MTGDDTLEVCIVTHANHDTIGPCIESVTRIGRGNGVSIAVCDNHPTEDSLDAARTIAARHGFDIRTIERRDNPGFAVACNELAHTSAAARLLFLNPDAELVTWPSLLRDELIGARVYAPDGREQPVYGIDRSLRDELMRRLQIPPRRPGGRGYVSGAAMSIPTELFLRVGGFDERFFMYYEDIDLCRRLNASGIAVRQDPDFTVRHVGAFSAARDRRGSALRSYASGRAFFHKWRGSSRAFSSLVALDCLVRVIGASIRLPVPGADGARSVLPLAVRDVVGSRRHASATPPDQPS